MIIRNFLGELKTMKAKIYLRIFHKSNEDNLFELLIRIVMTFYHMVLMTIQVTDETLPLFKSMKDNAIILLLAQ